MRFPWNNELKEITGTRSEVLDKLRSLANKNCSKCYGLGQLGYTNKKVELKNGKIVRPRTYIVCKCVYRNKN